MTAKKLTNSKTLIIGETLTQYGLAQSYCRAFKRLGFGAIHFDLRGEIPWIRIRPESVKDSFTAKIRRRLGMHMNYFWSDWLLRKKAESGRLDGLDLILVYKSPWLKPGTLSLIKRQSKALLFHFNADSPFDKGKANAHPNLIGTIPLYDCYFIWNKALIPKIYERGAKRVEYLPFAWDPELHPPMHLTEEDSIHFDYDISFIGNWDPDRERRLCHLMEFNMAIWGAYLWERANDASLLRHWIRQVPTGDQFVKVCLSSKINLNFLRDQNKGSHNMRSFEVPGCGGFLLTERSPEQSDFFEEDKEIACFSDPEELQEKIRFYLPRDELRREMAKAAHRKVADGHTYVQRAEQIANVYEEMR